MVLRQVRGRAKWLSQGSWNLEDWELLADASPKLEEHGGAPEHDLCLVEAHLDGELTISHTSPRLLRASSYVICVYVCTYIYIYI